MEDRLKLAWKLRCDPQVHRHWDALVVYHEPSGDVHVLSSIAEAVLESLKEAPRSTLELLVSARRAIPAERALPHMDRELAGLLEAMDEAGFIEKVVC